MPFILLTVFQTYERDTGFLRWSLVTVSVLGVVLKSLPPQKYVNINLCCDTYGSFFFFLHLNMYWSWSFLRRLGMGADALSELQELAPLPVLASLGPHDGVAVSCWSQGLLSQWDSSLEKTLGTGRYCLLVGSWVWPLYGSLFRHPNCSGPMAAPRGEGSEAGADLGTWRLYEPEPVT